MYPVKSGAFNDVGGDGKRRVGLPVEGVEPFVNNEIYYGDERIMSIHDRD